MNILVHIIFTVLFLAVVLHGQGAGGGDRVHGGRGGSRDGSYDGKFRDGSRGESYDGKYRDDSRDGNYDGKYRDGSRDGKFGGGGSRYSYSDYPKESGDYNRDRHRSQATHNHNSSLRNVFHVIVFLVLSIIFCCCIGGCFLLYKFKSKLTSNTTFTSVPTKEPTSEQQPTAFTSIPIEEISVNSENIFQSGIWSGRYYQNENWHDPGQLSLSFDSNSFTIIGNGSDDVGAYTVSGRYSTTTNEIELIKTYQIGTGDEQENLGHSVTIEVTWDPEKQLFAGNWYLDKSSYRDEDLFELKFQKPL